MSAPVIEETPIYDEVLAEIGLSEPVPTDYEVLAAEAVLQVATAKVDGPTDQAPS